MTTYVGITTSHPKTDQKPMELPNTHDAGSKMVPLHFRFIRVFQKSGGEKQWNSSAMCETYNTIWKTESLRIKDDVELHVMVQ